MSLRAYTTSIVLIIALYSPYTRAADNWGDFDFDFDEDILAEFSKSVEGFMSASPLASLFEPARPASPPRPKPQTQPAFFQQWTQAAQPFLEDIGRLGDGFLGPFFTSKSQAAPPPQTPTATAKTLSAPRPQQQPTATTKGLNTAASPASLFPGFDLNSDTILKMFTGGNMNTNLLGSLGKFGLGSTKTNSKLFGGLSSLIGASSPLSPQAKSIMAALDSYTAVSQQQDNDNKSLFQELKETLQGIDTSLNMTQIKTMLQRTGSLDIVDLITADDTTLAQVALASNVLEAKLCTHDEYHPSVKMPVTCTGPNITLSVQTGHCSLLKDKKVLCKPPKVVLIKTPGECHISHNTPTIIKTKVCKLKKEIGRSADGIIFGNKTIVVDISKDHIDIHEGAAYIKDGLKSASGSALDWIGDALQALRNKLAKHSMPPPP